MFKPTWYDEGKTKKIALAVSQTVVKGNALKWASGYLAVASTGAYQDVKYVALEDVTTSSVQNTKCLVVPVRDVRFIADCDAVVSIVDRGTYADMATKATINPDASTYDDFYIDEIVGTAETSTQVIGFFTQLGS